MKLSSVILRVSDVEAARTFWADLVGLTVVHTLEAFVFLDGGGTQLILSLREGAERDDSLTEVVFTVDDVRGTHAEMASRGVPFEVELRTITSDGERHLLGAHFRDPNGHYGTLTGWVEAQ
jgi:catechol 2,3-dioxygenase-like lactoylglutathione lyase family enzyme